MLKLLNQYPKDCTGCGACYNACIYHQSHNQKVEKCY